MQTRNTWLGGVLVACVAAGSAAAFALSAQTHDHGAASAPSSAPASATATAPAQDTMPMHDRMMAEMRANDAKLASLVKTMDGTTGDAKTDTMAAILRELVHRETAMRAMMDEMHAQMTAPGAAGSTH